MHPVRPTGETIKGMIDEACFRSVWEIDAFRKRTAQERHLLSVPAGNCLLSERRETIPVERHISTVGHSRGEDAGFRYAALINMARSEYQS